MKTISPRSVLKNIGDELLINITEEERSENIFKWLKGVVNEKREPIEFINHSFLKQPYRDWTPEQVYKKGAQVGITTMALLKTIFFAKKNKIDIIAIFPSATDVRKFCQGRFDAIVQRNPILRKYLGGLNSTELKEIVDSRIYFQGSWTERAALSVPADLLYIDELDRCRADVLEMYKDRLSASKYKWEWLLSTPTVPKFGIDALYEESNQFHWMVRCKHCNHYQTIKFETIKPLAINKADLNLKDKADQVSQINRINQKSKPKFHFACEKCGKTLNRQKGEWVAKFPEIPVHGYFISQLIAPWISADEIMDKKRNTRLTKNFWNLTLGLARSIGSGVLTRDVMLKCRRNYSMAGGGQNFYMGIDNSDFKHVVIAKRDNEIRKIFYIEKTESTERVFELIKMFGARQVFIDALPNKNFAQKLVKKFPGIVKMIYFGRFPELGKKGKDHSSIILNRSECLDITGDAWVEGKCTLPWRLDENLEEFISEMGNMEREERRDRYGNIQRRWFEIAANHYRMADLYCYFAEFYDEHGNFNTLSGGDYEPVSASTESEWTDEANFLFVDLF